MKIKSKHVIDLTIADIIRMVKVDQDLDGEIEINIIDETEDENKDFDYNPNCVDSSHLNDIF